MNIEKPFFSGGKQIKHYGYSTDYMYQQATKMISKYNDIETCFKRNVWQSNTVL